MVTIDSDNELVNQTRQYLAYLLYQQEQYRDASVVGTFLALQRAGIRHGASRWACLRLNSLQLLLVEDPDNAAAVESSSNSATT